MMTFKARPEHMIARDSTQPTNTKARNMTTTTVTYLLESGDKKCDALTVEFDSAEHAEKFADQLRSFDSTIFVSVDQPKG